MSEPREDGPRDEPASVERRASPEATASLLERARAGDAGAFDRLFARALPRLEWFVGLRLGGALRARLEPQDLVQETYAAALPLLADFEWRGEGSFVRWLFAIAENQIRRLLAHHGAQRRSGPAPGGPADAALALAADPASGPCTRAGRAERRRQVALALGRLREEQREALLSRLIEGRPLKEVAARMQRSESAVRRLLVRASDAFARELEGGQVGDV